MPGMRRAPRMRRAWAAAAAAVLGAIGCGAGARGAGPGVAEGRSYLYSDNSGLIVTTAALAVEQPLTRRLTATARGVADRILLERKPLEIEHQAGNQATGHHHADVVTSASAFAGGGEVSRKWRFEGTAGLTLSGDLSELELPSEVGATLRAGTEPDYGSVSAGISGKTELFERNTVLSASLGAGRDTVSPVEAPPGEAARWPASHQRLTAGITVSQVLSPRLVASGGVAGTLQRGTLENPYRRAIVRTSLFPERVPDARDRLTAALGLSWYPGAGFAVHLRQGFYADSWGVLAAVPEVGLARDFGDRLLLLGRYRFYRQLAADFYQARYEDLAPILTGDARLGRIREHVGGLEARWVFLGTPGEPGAVTAILGYELSILRYEDLPTDTIVAHIPGLGGSIAY